MKKLLDKTFPAHLCTEQDDRQGVKNGPPFLCLLTFAKHVSSMPESHIPYKWFKVLRPYVMADGFQGWADEYNTALCLEYVQDPENEDHILSLDSVVLDWMAPEGEIEFPDEGFPEHLCRTQGKKGVLVSEARFVCLLQKKGEALPCEVRLLTPFTSPNVDNPKEILWGWASLDGRQFFDHCERATYDDDVRVIKCYQWRA